MLSHESSPTASIMTLKAATPSLSSCTTTQSIVDSLILSFDTAKSCNPIGFLAEHSPYLLQFHHARH
jgi:hypothetical protein